MESHRLYKPHTRTGHLPNNIRPMLLQMTQWYLGKLFWPYLVVICIAYFILWSFAFMLWFPILGFKDFFVYACVCKYLCISFYFSLCLFCFITFFYLPVCFLKSEKKGINFNGGDDLRGGGGGKTLIRVNCMIKKSLKLKKISPAVMTLDNLIIKTFIKEIRSALIMRSAILLQP